MHDIFSIHLWGSSIVVVWEGHLWPIIFDLFWPSNFAGNGPNAKQFWTIFEGQKNGEKIGHKWLPYATWGLLSEHCSIHLFDL